MASAMKIAAKTSAAKIDCIENRCADWGSMRVLIKLDERIAIYPSLSEAERRDRLCVGQRRFVFATVYITANTGRLATGGRTESDVFKIGSQTRSHAVDVISTVELAPHPAEFGNLAARHNLVEIAEAYRKEADACFLRAI